MIKAKQALFLTSNLKGHSFHGDKANIFSSDWEDTLKCETPSSPTRDNFK